MSRITRSRALVATLAGAAAVAICAAGVNAGLGTPASPDLLRAWTTEIRPDGTGLPAGRGSVRDGEVLYERRCESCHGAPIAPALTGGVGTLARVPERTVNSYWPSAPTLFDYVRRAMPPDAPGSLDANQLYALCAYVLAQDDLVKPDAVLDASSLAKVRMPNRDGFTAAPR